eukprot:6181978-Pleurochrysis_carterae.AAC.1
MVGIHSTAATTAGATYIIEKALRVIQTVWLELHQLVAQTFFMPFALTALSLLSRIATLLAEHHQKLRIASHRTSSKVGQLASNQATSLVVPPVLLQLARDQAGSICSSLERIFGSSKPVSSNAQARSGQCSESASERTSCAVGNMSSAPHVQPNGVGTKQPAFSSVMDVDAAMDVDAEDLGEAVDDLGEAVDGGDLSPTSAQHTVTPTALLGVKLAALADPSPTERLDDASAGDVQEADCLSLSYEIDTRPAEVAEAEPAPEQASEQASEGDGDQAAEQAAEQAGEQGGEQVVELAEETTVDTAMETAVERGALFSSRLALEAAAPASTAACKAFAGPAALHASVGKKERGAAVGNADVHSLHRSLGSAEKVPSSEDESSGGAASVDAQTPLFEPNLVDTDPHCEESSSPLPSRSAADGSKSANSALEIHTRPASVNTSRANLGVALRPQPSSIAKNAAYLSRRRGYHALLMLARLSPTAASRGPARKRSRMKANV